MSPKKSKPNTVREHMVMTRFNDEEFARLHELTERMRSQLNEAIPGTQHTVSDCVRNAVRMTYLASKSPEFWRGVADRIALVPTEKEDKR